MITIRSLEGADSRQVARLHLDCLQGTFTGRPGLELLSLYYRAISAHEGACGFVAEQEGQLLGYVCGVWENNRIKYLLLKQHFVLLVFWGVCQSVLRPTILRSLLSRFGHSPSGSQLDGYELRPIVVAPSARGSGAANLLVQYLLEDAGRRGYRQVHLVTETDNIAAQKFYQKTGFRLDSTIERSGIPYFQYIKKLDSP